MWYIQECRAAPTIFNPVPEPTSLQLPSRYYRGGGMYSRYYRGGGMYSRHYGGVGMYSTVDTTEGEVCTSHSGHWSAIISIQ